MRRFRLSVVLGLLAAAALVVALLNQYPSSGGRWMSYVPLSGDEDRLPYSALKYMGVFDARLWLGIAMGLAVAAVVSALFSRRAS